MSKFIQGKELYLKSQKIGTKLIFITKFMIIIVCVLLILNLIEFVFLKLGFKEGIEGSGILGTLDFLYLFQGIFQFLYVLGGIVSGIVFLIWFYRSLKSLTLLGIKTSYSAPWSFWGWIVPFLNIIIPFKIMEDICKGTVFIQKGDLNLFKKEKINYTIQLRWVFWLLSTALGRYIGSDSFHYESISERISNYRIVGISDVFDILENITFLIVLIRVNKIQKSNIEENKVDKILKNEDIDNLEEKE